MKDSFILIYDFIFVVNEIKSNRGKIREKRFSGKGIKQAKDS